MAVWTDTQRANIRAYMGFPRLFADFNSRLESALTAIEQLDDSDATQDRMIAVLAKLVTLESQIEELHCTAFVESAGTDQVKINPIRAIHYLKMEGRRLIQQLAIPLGCRVQRDYFSAAEVNSDPTSDSSAPGQWFPYGG